MKYRVYKNYMYAEVYYVEANNEKEAIGIVDSSEIEPDQILQDFDFYMAEKD